MKIHVMFCNLLSHPLITIIDHYNDKKKQIEQRFKCIDQQSSICLNKKLTFDTIKSNGDYYVNRLWMQVALGHQCGWEFNEIYGMKNEARIQIIYLWLCYKQKVADRVSEDRIGMARFHPNDPAKPLFKELKISKAKIFSSSDALYHYIVDEYKNLQAKNI